MRETKRIKKKEKKMCNRKRKKIQNNVIVFSNEFLCLTISNYSVFRTKTMKTD